MEGKLFAGAVVSSWALVLGTLVMQAREAQLTDEAGPSMMTAGEWVEQAREVPGAWTVDRIVDGRWVVVEAPSGRFVNVEVAVLPCVREGERLTQQERERARLTLETCATDSECEAVTGLSWWQ
jgi:hypothetical protein